MDALSNASGNLEYLARSRMLPSVRPLMQHQRLRADMEVRVPEPHNPRGAHGTVDAPALKTAVFCDF